MMGCVRGTPRGDDYLLLFWATNEAKKRESEGPGLCLKRSPLAQPMQQPTKNSTNAGVGILEEIRSWWNVGGGQLPVVLEDN